jgi:hypothetical protein
MQVKNALNWKIFVLFLCDINQQFRRVMDTRSNTNYLAAEYYIIKFEHQQSKRHATQVDFKKPLRFRGSEITVKIKLQEIEGKNS